MECDQLYVAAARNLQGTGAADGHADVAVAVQLPRVAPRVSPSVVRAGMSVLQSNIGGSNEELARFAGVTRDIAARWDAAVLDPASGAGEARDASPGAALE